MHVPVWGQATPGEAVRLSFREESILTQANDRGNWIAVLPRLEVGAPGELLISSGENTVIFNDVLVGEVWLCSGQSNMAWPVERSANSQEEIANADIPHIRLFNMPNRFSVQPVSDIDASWEMCTPESVASFSAVGYFFGRKLHQELGVPIGLISANRGGSAAEAWMPRDDLMKDPAYSELVAEMDALKKRMMENPALAAEIDEEISAFVAAANALSDAPPEPAEVWFDAYKEIPGTSLLTPGDSFMEKTDGLAQIRKVFTLTEQQATLGEATLELGSINDHDVTWVNGTVVGKTGPGVRRASMKARTYTVPEGVLRPGKNVVVLQVIDHLRSASFGENIPYPKLSWSNGEHLALVENWEMKIIEDLGPKPDNLARQTRKKGEFLYNGMIAPLIPAAFRGVIWYQGESNAGRAAQYMQLFPDLIRSWRGLWDRGDFPFYYVQLANYRERATEPGESAWAELREAQRLALELPNTGMAVAIDIGEADDIHPRNKQDVGLRLALWALADTYKLEEATGWVGKTPLVGRIFHRAIPHSGPLPESVSVKKNAIIVRFDHMAEGLQTTDGEVPVSFAIAEEDGPFLWADAEIIKDDTIRLTHPDLMAPTVVRYAWADNPEVNLVNSAGLPASPFRTDNRKLTTAE